MGSMAEQKRQEGKKINKLKEREIEIAPMNRNQTRVGGGVRRAPESCGTKIKDLTSCHQSTGRRVGKREELKNYSKK